MDTTAKLPIGMESFEDIRRNGFYYVDKTDFSKKCCVCLCLWVYNIDLTNNLLILTIRQSNLSTIALNIDIRALSDDHFDSVLILVFRTSFCTFHFCVLFVFY